jgi:hypothetical protein
MVYFSAKLSKKRHCAPLMLPVLVDKQPRLKHDDDGDKHVTWKEEVSALAQRQPHQSLSKPKAQVGERKKKTIQSVRKQFCRFDASQVRQVELILI